MSALQLDHQHTTVHRLPARPSRPVALKVLFDNIPDELRALDRWVLWCYEWNEEKGKWKKPPYSPRTGRKCSVTDSQAWGSFDLVRARYEHDRGRWDGIGIALGQGLAGADLDHCLTDGLSPLARQIVGQLLTYTDKSPSGTGVKCFAFGTLPGDNRADHGQGVELYSSEQYFTVTGHALPGTVATVEERTSELAEVERLVFPSASRPPALPAPDPSPSANPNPPMLDDTTLIQKAMSAKDGEKFSFFWRGGVEAGKSQSEADLSLCNLLAFWTGKDASAMDRLFRQSALYRAKWDTRHYANGDTHGQRTIKRAIARCTNVYRGAWPTRAAGSDPESSKGPDVESTSGDDRHLSDVLQQVLIEREAERKAWAAEREALQRMLTTPIPEAARVLGANLILECKPAPEDATLMGRPLQRALAVEDASIPELAERYSMTESAVQRNLSRLDQARFLVRGYDKSHTYPNGKPAPYSIITGTTIYLAGFDELEIPQELPTTKQMDSQRNRAADTLEWAKRGKELYCPECHQQGLEGRCTHCGHVVKVEDEPSPPDVESTSRLSVLDVDSTSQEIDAPSPDENDILTKYSLGGGMPDCPPWYQDAPRPNDPGDAYQVEQIHDAPQEQEDASAGLPGDGGRDAPPVTQAPPSGDCVDIFVSVPPSPLTDAPEAELGAWYKARHIKAHGTLPSNWRALDDGTDAQVGRALLANDFRAAMAAAGFFYDEARRGHALTEINFLARRAGVAL